LEGLDWLCLKSQPKLLYTPNKIIDGDGTVVTPSALAMSTSSSNVSRLWLDLWTYNNSPLRGGSGSAWRLDETHASILEVPTLRDFIKNNILTKSVTELPKYISTSLPTSRDLSEKRLTYFLHSPLTLSAHDSFGNGISASTSTIPGARYNRYGEVQSISLPASSNPTLVLNGYEAGSFTLEVQEVEGDTTVATTTFSGIPSSASTVITMNFSDGTIKNASPLFVDANGDGTTDVSFEPKLDGVVVPDLIPPEILVSFSTTTQDVLITGTDNEGVQTTKTTATSTTVTDKGGNTLIVPFIKYKEKATKLKVTFDTLIYNGIATKIPQTTLEYMWEIKKDGTLKSLSQDIQIKNTRDISAEYESKKNETKIEDKYKGKERKDDEEDEKETAKITKKGMVLLKFSTDKGVVKIDY
jgi:hypothetical protein